MSFLGLTTDNWINVGMFGVFTAGYLYTRRKDKEDRDAAAKLGNTKDAAQMALDRVEIARIGETDKSLNKHLLDCAKMNGKVEEQLKGLRADVNKLTRRMDEVLRQLANLATGTHSLPMTIESGNHDE